MSSQNEWQMHIQKQIYIMANFEKETPGDRLFFKNHFAE